MRYGRSTAPAQTVLLGFLLLLLGIPAYVWLRKQQADEADAKPQQESGSV